MPIETEQTPGDANCPPHSCDISAGFILSSCCWCTHSEFHIFSMCFGTSRRVEDSIKVHVTPLLFAGVGGEGTVVVGGSSNKRPTKEGDSPMENRALMKCKSPMTGLSSTFLNRLVILSVLVFLSTLACGSHWVACSAVESRQTGSSSTVSHEVDTHTSNTFIYICFTLLAAVALLIIAITLITISVNRQLSVRKKKYIAKTLIHRLERDNSPPNPYIVKQYTHQLGKQYDDSMSMEGIGKYIMSDCRLYKSFTQSAVPSSFSASESNAPSNLVAFKEFQIGNPCGIYLSAATIPSTSVAVGESHAVISSASTSGHPNTVKGVACDDSDACVVARSISLEHTSDCNAVYPHSKDSHLWVSSSCPTPCDTVASTHGHLAATEPVLPSSPLKQPTIVAGTTDAGCNLVDEEDTREALPIQMNHGM